MTDKDNIGAPITPANKMYVADEKTGQTPMARRMAATLGIQIMVPQAAVEPATPAQRPEKKKPMPQMGGGWLEGEFN